MNCPNCPKNQMFGNMNPQMFQQFGNRSFNGAQRMSGISDIRPN